MLNLDGEPILDALVYSVDPFIKNISGSLEGTRKVLEKLSINPETKPEDYMQLKDTYL